MELALSTAGAAVDSDYVYTMGYTDGFGADALDIFLVKYDKDDNQIWNVTWYDSGAYKVRYYGVLGLTNIIITAGPGVNQISWKYFCNPWYAPVYT